MPSGLRQVPALGLAPAGGDSCVPRTNHFATRSLSLFALVLFATLATASPSKYQTGTTRLDLGSLSPGWVLFTAKDGVSYLIDPFGTPMHQWVGPDPDFPTLAGIEPILDAPGHVLALTNDPSFPGCENDCAKGVELDWDGNVVWEYADLERTLHHDMQRLENGNTLFLCSKTIDRPEIAPVPIVDDCLVEVSPTGDVVWEWQTADHYDELDLTDSERQMISDQAAGLNGDWAHANSIDSISSDTPHADPRFRPGNVIISYRHLNLVVVVDRDTDEIVWQNQDSIGQHHAQMIRNGLAGAGNIMVFDNGFGGEYPMIARQNSRVIEIDPLTDAIVFNYTAVDSGLAVWSFFSSIVGSAQRLANGNTLINEGTYGRAFEITPSGSIVWEFVNPTFSNSNGFLSNTVSRYTKVTQSWVAPFAGHPPSAPHGLANAR